MSIIGTAGWAVPAAYKDLFPQQGSQLERYAARLNGVEINSSFYRPHRRKTYERWAAGTPADFRFSVKVPRQMTHAHRLTDCEALLEGFLDGVSGLGAKLAVFLVQLPPSLPFEPQTVQDFFRALAKAGVAMACEPRHASWFDAGADASLRKLDVARVAADPPRAAGDGEPGGARSIAYWRLHGSPKIYYSRYDDPSLAQLAPRLGQGDWCIFDNTAAFQALGNALRLAQLCGVRQRPSPDR